MITVSKKSILFFIVVMSAFYTVKAQVTVGSGLPAEKAALLDLKTKVADDENDLRTSDTGGFLLPRVELDNINEFTVFSHIKKTDSDYDTQKKKHTGLMVYNLKKDDTANLEVGIYVWNGERWEKSSLRHRVNFFYMPSIKITASPAGYTGQIDLYQRYRDQFENPAMKSPGAPDAIPFYANRFDLYYYISYLDPTVFDIANSEIGDDGYFRYTILNPPADGESYVNIVFVVK